MRKKERDSEIEIWGRIEKRSERNWEIDIWGKIEKKREIAR